MVAIKGLEIPSCCAKCDFKEDYCFYCNKLQKGIPQSNFFDSRLPDCPLVEIGTCKDCKHFHNVRKDFNTCDLWTIACTDNHYCADFEKRGSENG